MVGTLSGKPICALFCLFEVSPALPLKRFQNWSDWWRPFWADPFEARSRTVSSFLASLLMATDGVMSMALCQQVVPQTAEHFSLWMIRKLFSSGGFSGCFLIWPSVRGVHSAFYSQNKCVANGSPAAHQTLGQQGGTGEDSHIHLADWTPSVAAIEKKKKWGVILGWESIHKGTWMGKVLRKTGLNRELIPHLL